MKRNAPEVELIALKAALDSPDERIKAVLLGGFRETMFDFQATREVYDRIRALIAMAKPIPTSWVMANDISLTDIARNMLLQQGAAPIFSEDDAAMLLEVLRAYEKGRSLFQSLQTSTEEMSKDNPNLNDVIKAMEDSISFVRLQDQPASLWHFGAGTNTDSLIQKILNPNDREMFIPTGFKGFDDRAGGLARNNLQIVACHRKGGKSILCLNEGLNMYHYGYSGCIVTLEMGEEEYSGRLLSSIAGVDYNKIRLKKLTQHEVLRVSNAYQNFIQHGLTNNCRLTIWPSMSVSLSDIGMLLKPYGFHFVIIDYLNLLKYEGSKNTPKHEVLNELARDCKILTGTLKCPVIAATQTDVTTGNIRYSRAIEEHADYVWTWTYGEAEEASGIIDVEQMVARHTERFVFKVKADYTHMRMVDYVPMPSETEQVKDTEMVLDYMTDN